MWSPQQCLNARQQCLNTRQQCGIPGSNGGNNGHILDRSNLWSEPISWFLLLHFVRPWWNPFTDKRKPSSAFIIRSRSRGVIDTSPTTTRHSLPLSVPPPPPPPSDECRKRLSRRRGRMLTLFHLIRSCLHCATPPAEADVMYLQIQITTIDGYSSLFSGVTVVMGRSDLNAEPFIAFKIACLGT